eukprot:4396618-Amphidinium_carterae.1
MELDQQDSETCQARTSDISHQVLPEAGRVDFPQREIEDLEHSMIGCGSVGGCVLTKHGTANSRMSVDSPAAILQEQD